MSQVGEKLREHLKEHGPSTASELPHKVNGRERITGNVRRFRINRGGVGGKPRIGTQYSVFFLEEHDPEAVVRKYLDANPKLTNRSLPVLCKYFNRLGEEYGEAMKDIADEYDLPERNNLSHGDGWANCPICGEEVASPKMPDHLSDHVS